MLALIWAGFGAAQSLGEIAQRERGKREQRAGTAKRYTEQDLASGRFVHGIPVQQQLRVFEETEELRQAKQAQAALEEKLRRASLPPGWARE